MQCQLSSKLLLCPCLYMCVSVIKTSRRLLSKHQRVCKQNVKVSVIHTFVTSSRRFSCHPEIYVSVTKRVVLGRASSKHVIHKFVMWRASCPIVCRVLTIFWMCSAIEQFLNIMRLHPVGYS